MRLQIVSFRTTLQQRSQDAALSECRSGAPGRIVVRVPGEINVGVRVGKRQIGRSPFRRSPGRRGRTFFESGRRQRAQRARHRADDEFLRRRVRAPVRT